MVELIAKMLIVMLLFIPGATASIIINEIMYNPPVSMGDDSDFEWIELYNNGAEEDLTGWSLFAGGKTVALSGVIPDDGYLVIARELYDGSDADVDCFTCYYGEMPALDGPAWSLSNTEGEIILCDPFGICSSIYYLDDWGADGDGSSLEFTGSEWLPSNDTNAVAGGPDGTPGHRNSRTPDNPISAVPEFSSLTAFLALGVGLVLTVRRRN